MCKVLLRPLYSWHIYLSFKMLLKGRGKKKEIPSFYQILECPPDLRENTSTPKSCLGTWFHLPEKETLLDGDGLASKSLLDNQLPVTP